MGEIFLKLVKNLSFEECEELIRETVGNGSDSNMLVHTLFQMSPDGFDSLFGRLNGFSGNQKIAANIALWGNSLLVDGNEENAMKVLKEVALTKDSGSTLEAMMKLVIGGGSGNGVEDRNYLDKLEGLARDLPTDKQQLVIAALARATSSAEPFGSWTLATKIMDANLADEIRKSCVSFMLQKDPMKAMEAISEASASSGLFFEGYQLMLKNNPKMAEQWLDDNRDKLDSEHFDSIRGVSVLKDLEAMKNLSDDDDQPKDFVGLWSQLDDISDPIVRKEVSSRLWSENFAAAKEDVRIDPVNALNQMVEGKSGYTDRFVEESLLIWMQQDRNACMSWYNQKWGNLSKEKAQDVAAAMARYAVGTRDLDAARQWLPHIYDDAIKNRIEGFINHVENAK